MADKEHKIRCQNLWKIFGPSPQGVLDSIKNGASKQEVMEKTGHVIAIRDVSFEVQENEVFVVMGLSGSGKSALVRCINRLMEPASGSIFIEDADVGEMNNHDLKELRRHKLSMVFQHFGLLPHKSVIDNITFGLEVRGDSKKERQERAQNTLELVGLGGWESSRIQELSGGMQQRVGLARALAVGPEILLMDEPFSALDPLIRRQMQEEFINLRSKMKKTVVFITHDLLEALTLGDRVAIMRDGIIVQLGTPEEIVTSPADDYVREFVKDVPRGKVIPVNNIMEEPLLVTDGEQPVSAAIKEMERKDTDFAFVVNSDGVCEGIFTRQQAMDTKEERSKKIGEVVSREFPTISPNAPLEQCLSLVAEDDTPVAVLDEEQHLVGVVTRPVLLRAVQSNDGDNGEPGRHHSQR